MGELTSVSHSFCVLDKEEEEREGTAQDTALRCFQAAQKLVWVFSFVYPLVCHGSTSQTFDLHLQCSKMTPTTKVKANQLPVYVRGKNHKPNDDLLSSGNISESVDFGCAVEMHSVSSKE